MAPTYLQTFLPRSLKLAVVAGAWLLLQVRAARAENALSYKYVDYREEGGRIAVESHYGLAEADLTPDMRLKLTGVIDAIAGATPTGQPPATPDGPVPLTNLHDRRKGWSAELFRQFPRVGVSVGYANSRESDYVSNGWSLNTLTDFNEKNTTLLLGVAGTDDDVKVRYQTPWLKKRTSDFIAGVTQLLDPQTSVSFNVGYGRATGYLSDPYRIIEQYTEVFPGIFLPLTYGENRPAARDKWTVFAGVNRAFPQVHGALEAGYRFYRDTFGTTAHTLELAWFQKLGEKFTLEPNLRLYDQGAADFYRIDVTGAAFTPTGRAMPQGPFFSSDYRLSALRTYNYGLKAIWTITAKWQVDLAYDRYEMRGKDSITSPSAYPRANTVTTGVRFTW
ncbi:MAG TPA: DUF3570 domain-containing protein [Opitutus sp.]|nr:DUF3570 domain-containing protein [Opitutus sp.]